MGYKYWAGNWRSLLRSSRSFEELPLIPVKQRVKTLLRFCEAPKERRRASWWSKLAERLGNRTSSFFNSSPVGDKSPNGARKLAVNPKNTGNKLSRTLLGSHPAIFYNIIQCCYYCEINHKN